MRSIKKIIFCLIINLVFIGFVDAKTVSCPYKLANKPENSFLPDTITVTIGEKSDSIQIASYTINVQNNSVAYNGVGTPPKNSPYLWYNKKLISAVDYYKKIGTCPEYFYISGMEMEAFSYNGYFTNEYHVLAASDHIYNSDIREYDENFEQTDEIYACSLFSSDPEYAEHEISVEINYTKKTISISGETTSVDGKKAMDKYKKNFDFSDSNKNKCPVNQLKVCSFGSVNVYPNDYEDSAIKNICATLDSEEEVEVGDNYCGIINNYLKEINDKTDMQKSKMSSDNLKSFCSNILAHKDYDSNEFSCINLCLNAEKYIEGDGADTGECGFSGRLMVWLSNILRWIKYILPVGVIVLGILDFIKAMGSDKDDEMKKAQDRFVKRLISAALVFIIPLILEFILDKMGFGYDDCGLF